MAGEMKDRADFLSRRGFTMTELLVVIAIIIILMSVLLPSLKNCAEKARQMTCGNNLKTLSLAHTDYYDKYDGYIPPIWDTDVDKRWFQLVAQGCFEKNWRDMPCFFCPSNPVGGAIGYARNLFVSFSFGDGLKRIEALKNPSSVLNLADTGESSVALGTYADYDYYMDSPVNTGYRHFSGANALFFDGHVAWHGRVFPNEWFR
jgi:prepilin-type N-terminal cleavage/methylation domain-containing protein/prepilin-type processing-associated H-X9-DG protein